ncbi:large-conductance mechanosensitive channel protein MscL [Tolumonas lignilytica]|jgi:large conductance mechanosensitive channel protein|uniref:large-conductance mechanosensitive channel protein MscL n=1 Tax=Tolumonas lignilytica TaxID=1283284 RepID=UPI000467625F|nr:large-conductance mechanosensitive channel protein MscL [Tolumonas lignilytica]
MFSEFKKFAMRGNVVDMAVGIVIGASFSAIVKSMVDDVLMPPIGLLLGGVDFSDFFLVLKEGAKAAAPYHTLAEAKAAGAVTLNFGLFVNAVISFTIVAFALFMIVKAMNKLRSGEEAAPVNTKKCPHCCSEIALEATRCPHCTSELTS